MAEPVIRNKPSVRVFLSYASSDEAIARRIAELLNSDGITCFFAPEDIKPREEWPARLEKEISASKLLILLYAENTGASKWVFQEVDRATELGKPVWLVKKDGVPIHPQFQRFRLESEHQAFKFGRRTPEEMIDNLLAELNQKFGRTDPLVRGFLNRKNNPYLGSAPYTAKESELFFGRSEESKSLGKALEAAKQKLFYVYGPSGCGKTSMLGAGLTAILPPEWKFCGPISAVGHDPVSIGFALWRQAELFFHPEAHASSPPDDSLIVEDLVAALAQAVAERHVIWFDHMEHLFSAKDQVDHFFRLTREILTRTESVQVIISFREESLSRAVDRAEEWFEPQWWQRRLIRKLSPEGARECVVQPARRRGIEIDSALADAIIRELCEHEGNDRDGKEIITANPVSLSLVCTRLWECGLDSFSRISVNDLPKSGEALEERVRLFVRDILENRLETAIQGIVKGSANPEQRAELIKLGLLQFVSENQRRQQLELLQSGNKERVGRLPFEIIKQLEDEGLVQRCESFGHSTVRYELVHDSVAEAIDKYRGKVGLLRTLNTLESALKSEQSKASNLQGFFDAHANLLADLEKSRQAETGFFEDEKEFMFRCALGKQRLTLGVGKISLTGWAELLAENDPALLVNVLREALSPVETVSERVRLDAVDLLLEEGLRARLAASDVRELGLLTGELAHKATGTVQERASFATTILLGAAGQDRIFRGLQENTPGSRQVVGWIRHAIDRCEIASPEQLVAFRRNWMATPLSVRVRIALGLWRSRMGSAFWRIVFVVALASLFTAVGAALAFVPMGTMGAALTLGDKAAGAVKGGFHGIAGGVGWAVGIASALLVYWVVFRGGRLTLGKTETILSMVSAGAGGFLGGVALSFLLAFVFQNQSLYNAGWLMSQNPDLQTKLADILVHTRHGWITPLFGLGVGVGVAGGLRRVLGDPRTELYVAQRREAIQSISQAFAVVRRIAIRVFQKSLPSLAVIALVSLGVFTVLRPGPGICDPTAESFRPNDVQSGQCFGDQSMALMPLPARVTGMVFIIWIGGLFLQIGFLFGIFSARVGVTLEQDDGFLRGAAVRRG